MTVKNTVSTAPNGDVENGDVKKVYKDDTGHQAAASDLTEVRKLRRRANCSITQNREFVNKKTKSSQQSMTAKYRLHGSKWRC